jgi:hypothetical protein
MSTVSDTTDCSRLPSSTIDGKGWHSGSGGGSAPPIGAVRPARVPGRTQSSPGRESAKVAPSQLHEENITGAGIPPSVLSEEEGDRQAGSEAGVQVYQDCDDEDPEDAAWLDSLAWDGSVHEPGAEARVCARRIDVRAHAMGL